MGAKKLTAKDRDEIARLHAQGLGRREIGRRIGRSGSTISAELTRGMWRDDNVHEEVYVAIHAQSLRNKRAKHSGKQSKLSYAKHQSLRAYVEQHIREGWSPEQISGRLPIDFPKDCTMRIGHEAIYRYIYAPEEADERLWEYLPRKQQRRRKQTGRAVPRCRIPDRVSIHTRPVAIEHRTQFGHWEGDTVEGKRGARDGIHTEVERKSRKLLARKVSRIASAETAAVQQSMFRTLPKRARRSTTLDNGRENHAHGSVTAALGIRVYFADPYSSWQRGSNEYHNGLLRRYLPKRTDFTTLTQAELDDIVEEINNRPRKCLDFHTPNEVFSKQLKKLRVFGF